MKTNRLLLLVTGLVMCVQPLLAQDFDFEDDKEKKTSWAENLFFGGNLGLQFGTITYLDISPLVGYRFNKRVSSGFRFTYQYYKDSRYNYSSSVYGAGVFSRVVLFRNIYAHAEYMPMNIDSFREQQRIWIHGVLVGGGYRQQIGDKAYVTLDVLWDLNHSLESPYENPLMRVGITF